jgi:hypothetical protein
MPNTAESIATDAVNSYIIFTQLNEATTAFTAAADSASKAAKSSQTRKTAITISAGAGTAVTLALLIASVAAKDNKRNTLKRSLVISGIATAAATGITTSVLNYTL